MPKRGDRLVYRCLAGFRYDAEVRAIGLDGRLDLAVDLGSADPIDVMRIAFVDQKAQMPGTCAFGQRATA